MRVRLKIKQIASRLKKQQAEKNAPRRTRQSLLGIVKLMRPQKHGFSFVKSAAGRDKHAQGLAFAQFRENLEDLILLKSWALGQTGRFRH